MARYGAELEQGVKLSYRNSVICMICLPPHSCVLLNAPFLPLRINLNRKDELDMLKFDFPFMLSLLKDSLTQLSSLISPFS